MSYSVKGTSCARCKAYLFDEDEIVVCPVCGAPHHRDCYDAIGHCALEDLHGTENQYNPNTARQQENENQSYQTPPRTDFNRETFAGGYNGNQSANQFGGAPFGPNPFMNFDVLGGVPKDYQIAENVTAEDAKKFVLTNTHRYIPKFASLSGKKRASWNWLAFLFPTPWLFSRKMYSLGFFTGFLKILSTLLSFPLIDKLSELGVMNSANYPQMVQELYKVIPSLPSSLILITLISSIINLSIMIIFGILGDYLYKNHTVSSVQKIKANSTDQNTDYRKKGGVNIFGFYLAYLALQIIPNIIITFI